MSERADTWIGRVREADAEAEAAYNLLLESQEKYGDDPNDLALAAIAAELRAQRIARRPGAGQFGPTVTEWPDGDEVGQPTC